MKHVVIDTYDVDGRILYDAWDVMYWMKEMEEILGENGTVNGKFFRSVRLNLKKDMPEVQHEQ